MSPEYSSHNLQVIDLPHLDYCSAVWGCIGNGLSQKLEKLQNGLHLY